MDVCTLKGEKFLFDGVDLLWPHVVVDTIILEVGIDIGIWARDLGSAAIVP